RHRPEAWKLIHVSLWAGSSLAAGLVAARWYGHYFIFILPPWTLLAGWAFESLAGQFRAAPGTASASARPFPAPPNLLAIGVVGAALLGGGYDVPIKNMRTYFKYINSVRATEPRDWLIAALRRECPPNERIVVWGLMPDIYVLSDRAPATRF